jgi:hypothetical protein
MAKKPNYLKAAFMVPANLMAMATAAISSAVIGDPLPVLVAAGVESIYLGVLSAAPRFRRAVRANTISEVDTPEELEQLLTELAPSQREHYAQLKQLRDQILRNYERLPGGRVLVASSEARVDALLAAFVRLLATLNSYRKYLNTSDRKTVERELSTLEADLATTENPRLREVKQRRVEILRRRLSRFQQAEESREVVSHQLAGIEDLLRLTHEQSIAIRDPESVSRQLEALSAEVQSTDETVREMERFMEFTEETGGHVPLGTRVR